MADLLNAMPCLGKFLSASIWGEPNGTWTLYEKNFWFMIFHHLKSAWVTIEIRKYLKIFAHAKQEIRLAHSHRDFGNSKSAHEHYMKKNWIKLKFHAPAMWDQPWVGNQARKSKLRVRPPRDHPKFRKLGNRAKQRKTPGKIDFSMFKIHVRSADAANHLKFAPGTSLQA